MIRRRSILTGLGAALAGLSLVAFPAHPKPAVPDRPAYLKPWTDPETGFRVTRITGDSGEPVELAGGRGTWGKDTRQHYSKDQPWSADGTLLAIENRAGGTPAALLLDGNSYRPLYGRPTYKLDEFRWHPSRAYAHVQIGLRADSLVWFDPVAGLRVRGWKLPFRPVGIGLGEGNTSLDGRFLALANHDSIVIVDMDPQPPLASYAEGNRRIGPIYAVAPCSLDVAAPDKFTMGNASVSPSGRYLDLKFGGVSGDSTADAHRIFDVDSATLALRPHVLAGNSPRCGSFQARPDGWIYPLKHADMALDPFDHDEDVIIGGCTCPGWNLGHVVMVRLRDGAVTALTDPKNEASVGHVSTRNLDRPGWAYVSYIQGAGKQFGGEIVAVKLDGSGTVEHFGHHRSVWQGCYRCEAQPVPSRDGRRVLFASNWAEALEKRPEQISAFIVDARPDTTRHKGP